VGPVIFTVWINGQPEEIKAGPNGDRGTCGGTGKYAIGRWESGTVDLEAEEELAQQEQKPPTIH
jgi:hypothetical protein